MNRARASCFLLAGLFAIPAEATLVPRMVFVEKFGYPS
jgi:hypothetical protein